MVDVLLIQPPIRDFYLTVKRTIPYGLTCLAAVLINDGFTVEILDGLATSKTRKIGLPQEMAHLRKYYGKADQSPFALFQHYRHFGYSFEHLGKKAWESRAFLVGISSLFTPYMQEAIQTAETVKAYHPDCKIVLGGHHPTALPESVMTSAAVDFVLRGEGEVSISLLAKAVRDKLAYASIPGIVLRKSNGSLHVNPPAAMTDLDHYPLPAAHLIRHQFYRRAKRTSAVVVASRGCPMKCSYCAVGATSALRPRRRSVASVLLEIEGAVNQYNAGFIDFEDENLSLDRRWFLKLLHEIRKRFSANKPELRAMNGLFPPSLDEEMIRAMKAAGFKALNLSLGSTSESQLKRFQRPDVRNAFDTVLNLAEKYGLTAVGYVIAGGPGQNAADSIDDLLFLARRRVLAAVSIFYPAPGAIDYELCDQKGILPDDFACMRSSALPLSDTTSRKEAITILRLARILNFVKSLLDTGQAIPDRFSTETEMAASQDRMTTGKQLLAQFLSDGKIRGITPQGVIYEHLISTDLSRRFLRDLKMIPVRGSR